MNSVHDMGGMAGFGQIPVEENEPVFHSNWERHIFALHFASLGLVGPIDRARHSTERINPADYLRFSYYEKWLVSTEMLLKEFNLISEDEIQSGKSISTPAMENPPPDAEAVANFVKTGMSSARDNIDRQAKFKIGDKVRARNINPKGHTRLPRYIRGHVGEIKLYHQCHVFPDTNAHDQGENPHPLYNVSFKATELWGEDRNAKDTVSIDLWEDYLESVEE